MIPLKQTHHFQSWMRQNDVCFHYFYLSIHKLPDDEIVLFGCFTDDHDFLGWFFV